MRVSEPKILVCRDLITEKGIPSDDPRSDHLGRALTVCGDFNRKGNSSDHHALTVCGDLNRKGIFFRPYNKVVVRTDLNRTDPNRTRNREDHAG